LRQTTQDKKNCRRLDAILRISTLKTYLARRKKKERYLPVEGKKKAKVVEVEEGASEFLFAFASLPLSLSSLPFQKKKLNLSTPALHPSALVFFSKWRPPKVSRRRLLPPWGSSSRDEALEATLAGATKGNREVGRRRRRRRHRRSPCSFSLSLSLLLLLLLLSCPSNCRTLRGSAARDIEPRKRVVSRFEG